MPALRLPRPAATGLKLIAVLWLAGLGACATVPPDSDTRARAEYDRLNDPLEPTNRVILDINEAFDAALFKPIAEVYDFLLPDFIQDRVTGILRNLDEPLTFVNDVLQGEPERAGNTLGRFITNSTIGLAGMFDPATDMGMERHTEDFGQTFAVWGIGEGPYLVLPFLGPSTVRDGFGTAVGFYAHPTAIAIDQMNEKGASLVWTATGALDARARNLGTLEELKKNSIDYYATLRSAYRQNRRAEVRNGAPPPADDDQFYEDFEGFEGLDDDAPQTPTADNAPVFRMEF